MAYSIVYGTAFPVPADDPLTQSNRVRVYVTEAQTYLGDETTGMAYVCASACLHSHLAREGFDATSTDPYGYVRNATAERTETADVTDADYGDEPYVRCEECGTELFRDDAAYLAAYGVPIPAMS